MVPSGVWSMSVFVACSSEGPFAWMISGDRGCARATTPRASVMKTYAIDGSLFLSVVSCAWTSRRLWLESAGSVFCTALIARAFPRAWISSVRMSANVFQEIDTAVSARKRMIPTLIKVNLVRKCICSSFSAEYRRRVFKVFGEGKRGLLLNHDCFLDVHAATGNEFFLFVDRVEDCFCFGLADFVEQHKDVVFNAFCFFVAKQVG